MSELTRRSKLDDLHEEGKKASNRKWKSWSVVLTGSQLIFIKEPTWALSLADHIGQLAAVGALTPGYLLSPRFNNFKPDEVFSLSSAVAIHDRAYDKVSFVVYQSCVAMKTGRLLGPRIYSTNSLSGC